MSADSHREAASDQRVRAAVVTVSDTRTEETDESGALLRGLLESAGHEVVDYTVLPDDATRLRAHLLALAPRADLVVTTGGTGLAGRDTTASVAEGLIAVPIPGFGELFRMLSWEEIGAAAMLSRAVAGVYGLESTGPGTLGAHLTLLFCCPGSKNAARLAADRLILPEAEHLVWEVLRQRPAS